MPKTKTRQELAYEFGMSRTTFYRLLKRMNISLSPGLVTPVEQEKIYQKLGNPKSVAVM